MKTVNAQETIKAIRLVRDAEVQWCKNNTHPNGKAFANEFIAGLKQMAQLAIQTVRTMEGT